MVFADHRFAVRRYRKAKPDAFRVVDNRQKNRPVLVVESAHTDQKRSGLALLGIVAALLPFADKLL
jgi:hypothetical protein